MSSSTSSNPLLSLRMKTPRSSRSSPAPPSERFVPDDDLMDRLRVMLVQEESTTYKCRDYLLRRKLEKMEDSLSCDSSVATGDSVAPSVVSEVDTLCREKMCEWSYRVVDHFNASREIVAIAFSYIDRFVDRCCCDRTAFKLAAMTSIYLATKVFNNRDISMSSLAELSRGEFDLSHISEMEGIILQTLEWRMQPPTTQCFINYLHALLPVPKGAVTRAIYQRSTFFAELSLFDYCFVTQARSAVALAALLNAMEGMEGSVTKAEMVEFSRIANDEVGLKHAKETIDSIRNRLWYVYSQSAQYQEDDTSPYGPNPRIPKETRLVSGDKNNLSGGDQSPVCVSVVTTK